MNGGNSAFNKLTNNKNTADAGAEGSMRLDSDAPAKQKDHSGRVIFFDPVRDNLSLGVFALVFHSVLHRA